MSTGGGRRVSEPIAHKAPKSRDGVIKQMSPQSCGMAVEDDGFVEGLNNKIGYLYHRLLVAEFCPHTGQRHRSRTSCAFISLPIPSQNPQWSSVRGFFLAFSDL